VLSLIFGTNTLGRPDTRAAAAALGVSQRTVQRWLHGTARNLAKVPAERLRQIHEFGLPDPETLAQESKTADYAREAIARIALPKGRGVLPAWQRQNWLEPHIVAVLELPDRKLRQVGVARVAGRSSDELRKRGEWSDWTVVQSRFHATVLAHELLTSLTPWRIKSPAGWVKRGPTQTWLADAPSTDVAALAVTSGLR
jgi:transcriptional regulator with XRE-family HTH domain